MYQNIICPDCWNSNVQLSQKQGVYICKHCNEKFDASKYEPCTKCGKLHYKDEGCVCKSCYEYIYDKQ